LTKDPFASLEVLIDLKFDRLLSSGQDISCLEGLELLVQLIKVAENRIIIVLAGGITPKNIKRILSATNAKEYHASARLEIPSLMAFKNSSCFMGGEIRSNEYSRKIVDSEKVKKIINNSYSIS